MPGTPDKVSRFYASIGLLIVLNLVVKPLWIFAIDLQVQNIIGTQAYGNYFSIFNLAVVFSFITDFGFTLFINQSTSANPEGYQQRTGQLLLLKVVLAIIYIWTVVVVAWISGIHDWYILVLVLLVQVLTSFFLFLRGVLTGLQKFTTGALLSVLDKFLMIMVCGVFIYLPFVLGSISLISFLWIQVLALLATILVIIIILGWDKLFIHRLSWKASDLKIFRAAWPFSLLVFLMGVHNRIDGFLLERLHPRGDYEAGMYAAAYRLLDAALMPGNLLIAFLLPFLAKRILDRESIVPMVLHARHFLMMIATGVFIFCILMAPWLQQLLYDHPVDYGARVLTFMILSIIGFTLIQVYGTVLTAAGNIRVFIFIILIAAGINLLLNILLIPVLGAMGSAISAIISQTACGIYLMFFVSNKYRLPLHLPSWGYYSLTGLLCAALLLYGLHNGINVWLLLMVYIILGFALLYLVIKPGLNRSLLV